MYLLSAHKNSDNFLSFCNFYETFDYSYNVLLFVEESTLNGNNPDFDSLIQNVIFTKTDCEEELMYKLHNNDYNLVLLNCLTYSNYSKIFHRLKQEKEQLNTPVIAIFQKPVSEENRIDLYQAGIIDVINYPFRKEMLIHKINNLLRHFPGKKRNAKTIHLISSTTNNSNYKLFLKRLTSIVGENISNPDFSNHDLCSKLNMSTSSLYRKMIDITGISPNKFIQYYRLKRAADLLFSDDLNISELAYSVGFSNPSYFSRIFKSVYKKTPRQYQSQLKNASYKCKLKYE